MIRVKIKEVAFECDEEKGIGRVIADGYTTEYTKAENLTFNCCVSTIQLQQTSSHG